MIKAWGEDQWASLTSLEFRRRIGSMQYALGNFLTTLAIIDRAALIGLLVNGLIEPLAQDPVAIETRIERPQRR